MAWPATGKYDLDLSVIAAETDMAVCFLMAVKRDRVFRDVIDELNK